MQVYLATLKSMKDKKRSVCPVACTLDILGDKWTLLIIRDLFLGKQHFKEFAASPEKIATNILSDRLDRLRRHGIIETEPSDMFPGRSAYRLTVKGESLLPVIKTMRDWGLEYIDGTQVRLKSVESEKRG